MIKTPQSSRMSINDNINNDNFMNSINDDNSSSSSNDSINDDNSNDNINNDNCNKSLARFVQKKKFSIFQISIGSRASNWPISNDKWTIINVS